MSLTRYTDYQISIDLPAMQGLKRKATVQGVPILLSGQQVKLDVAISYVDDDGNPLEIPGLSGYTRSLTAGMDTFVDMKTGAPLCDISEEYVGDELNPVLIGASYGYEFEYMMLLMKKAVKIQDIIIAKLQYAASLGRLD